MRKLPVMVRKNTKAICGLCKGACCKRAPGETHPRDFGAPDRVKMAEMLFARLSTGLWAIDHWVGDPRVGRYDLDIVEFVRPATAGAEGQLHHGSWGGPCALLTDDGCSLRFNERPFVCRAFVPGERLIPGERLTEPARGCDGHMKGGDWGRRDIAVAWIPYAAVLVDVAIRICVAR